MKVEKSFLPDIQPADLIFTHSNSLLGRGIRWANRACGESQTWTNHTAGIGLTGNVIEADVKVISTDFNEWVCDAKGNKKVFQLWRYQGFDKMDKHKYAPSFRSLVADYAESQVNRLYGFLKIIPHFLDSMISKTTGGNPYLFRRLLCIADYPICSWVWGFAYSEVGIDLGGDPRFQTPDDQLDYVIRHRVGGRLRGDWERIM